MTPNKPEFFYDFKFVPIAAALVNKNNNLKVI